MAGTVAELKGLMDRDQLAVSISQMWDSNVAQRSVYDEEISELRNYVFATDTTTTTNSKLPWKNSTTQPKLCQIRDNLHANYISALFPNDDWLRWEAYSQDGATKKKRIAIQEYIANKVRMSDFRQTVSQLLYDYIDTGNAFADAEWVDERTIDVETGEVINGFVGPKAIRHSYYDITFNPLAADWKHTPKITRTVKTMGELKWDVANKPEMRYLEEAVAKAEDMRGKMTGYRPSDVKKALGFTVDGFGDMQTYYQSGVVEILELEGSMHDPDTGEYLQNYIITILDRTHVLRKVKNPSWLGQGYKQHVGWRLRPDNLYAMGPLSNLVGLQYRLDHLENLKADLFDLAAAPPLVIKGNVDEFEWGPFAKVYMDENGSVDLMRVESAAFSAGIDIENIKRNMEEFAGAPREAMGIRTAGEKTAFEVQTLSNAGNRIFQEKITNFEINILEPLLNAMLELARRNLDGTDIIRVMDNDIGTENFLSVTKEDITANGKLRPIGARHFASQAQLVQNLTSLSNTPIWQATLPHLSSISLAKLVEDVMGLSRFALFQENIAITEQQETQRLANQSQEDLQMEQSTEVEPI